MPRHDDPKDPKGLIRESYRIEGISVSECRSIFLDWAISVPVGEDAGDRIKGLLEHYGGEFPDHPMTGVLREALAPADKPGRRGGARGRRGD